MAVQRIRICQLTPCLWSGGTEERIARVLSAMSRAEFELSWLGFGPLREALVERAGPDVRAIPVLRNAAGGIEPSIIFRLAAIMARLRPDVVHVHNWSTSLYGIGAARLAGVPTVIYGLGGMETPEPPPARRQGAMRALAPHVDRFTAVCEYLGRDIVSYWNAPADKIEVLRTGIDLQDIDRAPPRSEVRARFGIPDDALVVGAISVFRPVKRIPDLIDAVGFIARLHPNLHLLLIGNPLGVTPEELRERAAARGIAHRFHMAGRVEKPAHALPAFDVFVNCSAFEGSSNAIIEAMGARIPVVATRVGGTPELVDHLEHGLLVEVGNTSELAAALNRMLEDASFRKSCGEAGRRRVEARHTFAKMIDAYLDLYRQCAESRDRAALPRRLRTLSGLGQSLRSLAARP